MLVRAGVSTSWEAGNSSLKVDDAGYTGGPKESKRLCSITNLLKVLLLSTSNTVASRKPDT